MSHNCSSTSGSVPSDGTADALSRMVLLMHSTLGCCYPARCFPAAPIPDDPPQRIQILHLATHCYTSAEQGYFCSISRPRPRTFLVSSKHSIKDAHQGRAVWGYGLYRCCCAMAPKSQLLALQHHSIDPHCCTSQTCASSQNLMVSSTYALSEVLMCYTRQLKQAVTAGQGRCHPLSF